MHKYILMWPCNAYNISLLSKKHEKRALKIHTSVSDKNQSWTLAKKNTRCAHFGTLQLLVYLHIGKIYIPWVYQRMWQSFNTFRIHTLLPAIETTDVIGNTENKQVKRNMSKYFQRMFMLISLSFGYLFYDKYSYFL